MAGIAWILVARSSSTISDKERLRSGIDALLVGNIEEAEASLREVTQSESNVQLRRLLEGGLRLRSGNPLEALKYLSAVTMTGELRTPSLLLLGECYYRVQRHAEAELCFLRVISEEPDQVDARRWLGAIYYDLGTVKVAVRQIEHVIRLAPGDYRPHRLLGIIYHDIDDYPLAVEQFRMALSCKPPTDVETELEIVLAKSLLASGDYMSALDVIEQTHSNRYDPVAATVLAECIFGLGDVEKANAVISDVVSRRPDDRDALLLRARIEQENQSWSKAIATLEKIVGNDSHDHEARYLLATAFAQIGDEDRWRHEMALCEQAKQLKAQATDLYAQADENPTDPDIRDKLAEVCDQLGKRELAAMWRRAAKTLRTRRAMKEVSPIEDSSSPETRNPGQ